MDRRKKKSTRVAAAPAKRKPTFRDMTIYTRLLKLPTADGFLAASRADVSNDIRAVLKMPRLSEAEAEEDRLLMTNRELQGHRGNSNPLPVEVAASGGPDVPEPEAARSRSDERPALIAALEAAAYDGVEADEGDDATEHPLDLLPPARHLSGWVAARLVSEATTADCAADSARPRFSLGPAPFSSFSTANPGLGSTSAAGGFGWVRGSLLPVAMAAVRPRLSLSARMAALPMRREELDERFLDMRRNYVADLKDFALEHKERTLTIDTLRTVTQEARAKVRPAQSSRAFASDADEWRHMDVVHAAAAAILRQNVQLRARLAASTARLSGSTDAELSDAAVGASGAPAASASISGDILLQDVKVAGVAAMSGGAKQSRRRSRRRGGGIANAADEEMDEDYEEEDRGEDETLLDANVFQPRRRTESRYAEALKDTKSASTEVVLAVGDLVATPYGRGIVLAQGDAPRADASTRLDVLLRWGATASVSSKHVALLAIAGEQFLGPPELDASLLAPMTVKGPRDATPASATVIPRADDLLFGGPKKSARTSSNAKASSKAASAAAVSTLARTGGVAFDSSRGAERGVIESIAEALRAEAVAGANAVKRIKSRSGLPYNSRIPVFRSGIDRPGARRGVPLSIDPLRGVSALGFIVGVADGSGSATATARGGADGPRDLSSSPVSAGRGVTAAPASVGAGVGGLLTPGAYPVTSPNGGGSGSARGVSGDVLAVRAEVARLRTQLVSKEELLADQRRRLTDARTATARLISVLNETRIRERELIVELDRAERESTELATTVAALRSKLEPASAANVGAPPSEDAIEAVKRAAAATVAAAHKKETGISSPPTSGLSASARLSVHAEDAAAKEASGSNSARRTSSSAKTPYRGLLRNSFEDTQGDGGDEGDGDGDGDGDGEEEEDAEDDNGAEEASLESEVDPSKGRVSGTQEDVEMGTADSVIADDEEEDGGVGLAPRRSRAQPPNRAALAAASKRPRRGRDAEEEVNGPEDEDVDDSASAAHMMLRAMGDQQVNGGEDEGAEAAAAALLLPAGVSGGGGGERSRRRQSAPVGPPASSVASIVAVPSAATAAAAVAAAPAAAVPAAVPQSAAQNDAPAASFRVRSKRARGEDAVPDPHVSVPVAAPASKAAAPAPPVTSVPQASKDRRGASAAAAAPPQPVQPSAPPQAQVVASPARPSRGSRGDVVSESVGAAAAAAAAPAASASDANARSNPPAAPAAAPVAASRRRSTTGPGPSASAPEPIAPPAPATVGAAAAPPAGKAPTGTVRPSRRSGVDLPPAPISEVTSQESVPAVESRSSARSAKLRGSATE